MMTSLGQRGTSLLLGIGVCLVFLARPANGQLQSVVGSLHGTTTVTLPANLCTVRVDTHGNITGNGSRFAVSHSDPGTSCSKVKDVDFLLYGACGGLGPCSYYLTPARINLNLCNFNERDALFDFVFPGVNVPSQLNDVANAWAAECRASGKNGIQIVTKHPWFNQGAQMNMSYNNGDWTRGTYGVPPVILTCDPCPPPSVKDSMQLQPDTMVTLSASSVVIGGGVAPFTISFSNLPIGMTQQGDSLTGRPAKGTYAGTVTVRDSCRSAKNDATKAFRFDIKDRIPPQILTFNVSPMVFDYTGGKITVSASVSDDAAVKTVVAYEIKPDGQQSPVYLRLLNGTSSNGNWQISWDMLPNSGSDQLVYGVKVRAWDTSDNWIESKTLTITVAGRPKSDVKKLTPYAPGKK
jgi:hypothetical protein